MALSKNTVWPKSQSRELEERRHQVRFVWPIQEIQLAQYLSQPFSKVSSGATEITNLKNHIVLTPLQLEFWMWFRVPYWSCSFNTWVQNWVNLEERSQWTRHIFAGADLEGWHRSEPTVEMGMSKKHLFYYIRPPSLILCLTPRGPTQPLLTSTFSESKTYFTAFAFKFVKCWGFIFMEKVSVVVNWF